ncbi:MAG: glycoside hydrolase family 38 N-terminal domain-containing protein [Anaerolineae bacterium]
MAQTIAAFRALKTIFLVERDGALRQVVRVQIDNCGTVRPGTLTIAAAGEVQRLTIEAIARGVNQYEFTVPDVAESAPATFSLKVEGERHEHSIVLEPVRRWWVYLVPFSHHDLGYTDLPEVCIQQHREYFERIVDYCRQTDGFPEEARFRWTCDTTWAVKWYLESADAQAIARFFDYVRDGRIEITGQYAAFNSALLTHEELARSIYYAHELGRRHGFTVTSAMTTDIPGHPWGWPQVLAKSGIRYLSTAVNQNWAQDGVPRAKVPRISRPFYWTGSDGSEVLVWNSDPKYIYTEGRELGLTVSIEEACERLPGYLQSLEAGGHAYDAVDLRTTCKTADNAPPCVYLSSIVREWNERWAFPKLIIATSTQFFRYMEEAHAAEFPHYAGDWTDWWADGPGSSAYETGITRVAHEELASAEKWHAVAAAIGAAGDYPREAIERAWDQVLIYDEHTWGMWNNESDPFLATTAAEWATKAAFAKDAVAMTHDLLRRGLAAVSGRIATGAEPAIAVCNALSWERSDLAEVRLEGDLAQSVDSLHLEDESGAEVPHQVVERHQGGSAALAFVAPAVPSLGYRTLRLAPGTRAARAPSGRFAGNVLENRFYRVTLDPCTGGIAGLVDKELGVDLVDGSGGFTLNQFVYDSGEPPIFGRFSPESAQVLAGASGPLWTSAATLSRCRMGKHVHLSEPHYGKGRLVADVVPWLRQEVILYEDVKRIDIINRLYKEETLEKEGVYFAFPLSVPGGRMSLEVAGASMRPGIDQLPDSCHDWHNVQYWLDVSGRDYGITWSAREVPLVSIGDINTGRWQSTLDTDATTFFAYAMNNYWTTNFKERQGGDFTFRFSLTSHGPDWDRARAARFGWGYCTDLQTAVLPAGQSGPLPAAASFLSVDSANVMAIALKGAEDGDGLVVRLVETAGRATTARLTLPGMAVREARRCSIVERDREPLAVDGSTVVVPLGANAIETVRIRGRWGREDA